MTSSAETPSGFGLSERTSPFIDLIGPLHVRGEGTAITLALRAEEKHANARGRVHGAIHACLLDLVCGRCAVAAGDGRVDAVTASLHVDFISAARVGDWLEATATVTHRGRRLAFVSGKMRVGDRIVATADGVFAVGMPEDT